jgi:hypothetical protein
MLEILILLELVAFTFLIFGIIPFKKTSEAGNLPLANKIIFIVVALILFSSLAVIAVNYEYTYCYVNETVSAASTFINEATCNNYQVENIGLSYINWGMATLCLLVGIAVALIASLTKNDQDMGNE